MSHVRVAECAAALVVVHVFGVVMTVRDAAVCLDQHYIYRNQHYIYGHLRPSVHWRNGTARELWASLHTFCFAD